MHESQEDGKPASPANGEFFSDRWGEQQPVDQADTQAQVVHTLNPDEKHVQLLTPSTPQSKIKQSPDTPSTRTGPPRTLSYNFSPPHPRVLTRNDTIYEGPDSPLGNDFVFGSDDTNFRGALDYDGKGKKRESTEGSSGWNLWGRFHDSPKEEKEEFNFDAATTNKHGKPEGGELSNSKTTSQIKEIPSPKSLSARTRRSFSVPRMSSDRHKAVAARWGRLRLLLPTLRHAREAGPDPSTVTSYSVNITDELITGGLSTFMLRLWFERDEKGQRRVPVLLHRLRIRVSDSLHPLHGHKAVFRIECEYANGAAKWVIYRQLRDFISLHTHYTLSNAFNRNADKLPQFPRTSLPYFKFLRKQTGRNGVKVGRREFARIQREALENYLIDLIRAVMFHPSSNRLCAFLEISALSIALAQSGGAQYKAGFLRIQAVNNNGAGFGRKSTTWRDKRTIKWCAVRESYLVVLEELGELTVWDVFLMDSDFTIERPTRYYRQSLNLFHSETHEESRDDTGHPVMESHYGRDDDFSLMGSIRSKVTKMFCKNGSSQTGEQVNGNTSTSIRRDESAGSSSRDSSPSRPPTPMLDPSTNANPLLADDENPDDISTERLDNVKFKDVEKKKRAGEVSKHTFYIENSQTRLKIFAPNERQMLQWITALEKVAATSHYTGKNRFDSFAPIRLNVSAQWLVDGRDYMWNLSRALLLARETILIHDWWLSPELQLRRPNKEKYRLDRLLERKAKEGVQIYIILYQEVSSRTTPIDSNYTKQRLASLHPNIMIQRSPSHLQTGTFYWAHHEKLCVVDNAIAFMGGIDLCFGRWDTPQHVLVDDFDADIEYSEIWPGKDYSNPRVYDFHTLNRPEEDMYDRTKVPRMPWHDVGLQIVGQPARDLARHFTQRWNFLLRIKNHKRFMPFLLPPADYKPAELSKLGLSGTCEIQICRSAGPWSMGTPSRIEHSIQNAYLKAIQMSEHFVYIENQFFITSTAMNDVKIENKIGDALVHRIIRAHRENTPWKCCMVIPAMPGFTYPVDHDDASALRIIMELQNRTISRGPNSLFARLLKEGIDPNDYISIFALRNWAKLRGDILTTEQVYIHGKTMIVDDRLAIIGSANVNERSQRGDRDSEIAAVIRDTDMIDCTMAGKSFKVGRFAHSLRVRLMQEHLGVNVDALPEDDLRASEPLERESEQNLWDPDFEQELGRSEGVTRIKSEHRSPIGGLVNLAAGGIDQAIRAASEVSATTAAKMIHKVVPNREDRDVTVGDQSLREESGTFVRTGEKDTDFVSSSVPTMEEKIGAEQKLSDGASSVTGDTGKLFEGEITGSEGSPTGMNGDVPGTHTAGGQPLKAPTNVVGPFQTDKQPPQSGAVADDDDLQKEAPRAPSVLRKHLISKLGGKTWTVPTTAAVIDLKAFEDPLADEFWNDTWVAAAAHNTEVYRKVFHAIPDNLITTWTQYRTFVEHHERLNKPAVGAAMSEPVSRVHESGVGDAPEPAGQATPVSESRRGPKPFEKWERDEMERLLGTLNGNLVEYPIRFLEAEDIANNFLFNSDRLLPVPIYS